MRGDGMSILETLRPLVDRHTEQRIGNGRQPVPSTDRLITSLYEVGRPMTDIALAVDVDIADVMAVLGIDWRCSCCGNGCDLNDGQTAYAAEGDQDYPFWGTSCCGAAFLNRRGCAYLGDDPRREAGL
jgi:hypothetical protein